MNRRSTLKAFIGQKKSLKKDTVESVNNSLAPYTGVWTFTQAAHLLRRTMFGANRIEIEQSVEWGLATTIDQLFQIGEMPNPPINYQHEEDTNAPIGETWVLAPYFSAIEGNVPQRVERRRSLRAWTMGTLINADFSIREKLTLFWHNHFVVETSALIDARFFYKYITLLRENALGNFRTLTKQVTIDPAMLHYLDGFRNSKEYPNENYARELLELFTVGKGKLADAGDYTTFTEHDVLEIAKVMTGWRTRGNLSSVAAILPDALFSENQHDESVKQLSHRFNNAVIENAGAQEYANLIDIIFQSEATALNICRKLYRWFVYYDINESIEQDIIQPMAQILIENDYNISSVLKALLTSEHFYNQTNVVGGMIKHPIDYIIGLVRQLVPGSTVPLLDQYHFWNEIHDIVLDLEMQYFRAPDVGGWKAFYSAPNYYRIWITPATLGPRISFVETLISKGIRIKGVDYQVDVLGLAAQVKDNTDPDLLIEGLAALLFPQPLTPSQKNNLKNILIPGLPNFEWTVEYGDYLADPENGALRISVRNRLRALIKAMLIMPEYQLS